MIRSYIYIYTFHAPWWYFLPVFCICRKVISVHKAEHSDLAFFSAALDFLVLFFFFSYCCQSRSPSTQNRPIAHHTFATFFCLFYFGGVSHTALHVYSSLHFILTSTGGTHANITTHTHKQTKNVHRLQQINEQLLPALQTMKAFSLLSDSLGNHLNGGDIWVKGEKKNSSVCGHCWAAITHLICWCYAPDCCNSNSKP